MPGQTTPDILIAAVSNPRFRHDDNVRGSHRFLVQTERFPDKSLDPVSRYRVTRRSRRNGQTQSGLAPRPRSRENRKQTICRPDGFFEYFVEIPLRPQTELCAERTLNGRDDFAQLTVDASGRQPRPALGTPTSQDLAPVLRGHPCPESVVALASQITRLEGALHCSALRCLYGSRRRTVAPAAKGGKS